MNHICYHVERCVLVVLHFIHFNFVRRLASFLHVYSLCSSSEHTHSINTTHTHTHTLTHTHAHTYTHTHTGMKDKEAKNGINGYKTPSTAPKKVPHAQEHSLSLPISEVSQSVSPGEIIMFIFYDLDDLNVC